jgi:hypothetical protein
MELPYNVLALIREYSKPITRPDWKIVRPLPALLFYADLNYIRHKYKKQLYIRVFSNLTQTEWGRIYTNVQMFGIQYASNHCETSVDEIYKMPGMMYAQDYYITNNDVDEQFYHTSFSHILEC